MSVGSQACPGGECTPADLDFNGTALTLELVADLSPQTVSVTIPVYNDGTPEEEEGLALLIGVLEEDLDKQVVSSVEVLEPVVLVALLDSGESA